MSSAYAENRKAGNPDGNDSQKGFGMFRLT
jgi:hypothetical protein